MADEKNKDYNLDNFDKDKKCTPSNKKSENTKNEVDYGDGFDVQTGEDNEKHNPEEYYISRSNHKNKKKESTRKIKNAVIITGIAVVCLLVVFAFSLTKCSMTKIDLFPTTVPAEEILSYIADLQQDKETQVQTEAIQNEETQYIEETDVVQDTTESVTEAVSEVETTETESTVQEVETEPETQVIDELPDPEYEDYGQDLDY